MYFTDLGLETILDVRIISHFLLRVIGILLPIYCHYIAIINFQVAIILDDTIITRSFYHVTGILLPNYFTGFLSKNSTVQ